jgi:hypothetical protein
MVGYMIAIVKEEKIKRLAAEIPGMVKGVIFIRTIVLEIIGAYDTPCRVLMWQYPEEQGTFPVDDNEGDIGQYHEAQLQCILPEPFRPLCKHPFGKGKLAFQDIAAQGVKEKKLVKKIDLEAHLGRTDSIFLMLCVLVMTEVMPRHIGAHRVSVRERQDKLKELIHAFALEYRRMDRIVDDDSAGEREKTVDHHPKHYLPGSHSRP